MILGVIKFGRLWAILVDAQKPVDKRIKIDVKGTVYGDFYWKIYIRVIDNWNV